MTTSPDTPLILVVDDDPVTRMVVRKALERLECCSVLEANDGLAAQVILEERTDVDMVLTDILMPGLGGLDLLRWGRLRFPGLIWIILSGLDTFGTAVEAIRLGAFDFLAKPVRIEELEVAVRNALERHRLLQERDRLHEEVADKNRQLEMKVAELEEKSALLRRDLERAEVIQEALLPKTPPTIEHYSVHALYRPGGFVGGDLYDVVRLDDRHLAFYVADSTGHGVTAAMLSVLFKQRLHLLDEASGAPIPPGEVLATVNRALGEAVSAPGLFLTAVYCLLDTVDNSVTVASAGHPPLLLVRADGQTRFLKRTGPALGLTSEAAYSEERITLNDGDRLLLYTDGLVQNGLSADSNSVRELLCRCSADEALVQLLGATRSTEPDAVEEDRDDITLLMLNRAEGESNFDNRGSERSSPTGATIPRPGVLFYGEDNDASYLALVGRAIWTHCDALQEAAHALLSKGRPLVLELSACEYLDSTSLGTIHELAGSGNVHLHGVQPAIRALFEELSMENVLACIDNEGTAPELYPMVTAAVETGAGKKLLLRAHEVLAGLSPENREKFSAVVEALRSADAS